MIELDVLQREVGETLARVRAVTGVAPRLPQAVGLPLSAGTKDHAGRVARATRRQRDICAGLRRDLAEVREERQELARQVNRLDECADTLARELELVARGLARAQERRRDAEQDLEAKRAGLRRLRSEHRKLTAMVLETQATLSRLSERFKELG